MMQAIFNFTFVIYIIAIILIFPDVEWPYFFDFLYGA